ncbi:hypothetical protein GALMADRAFT_746803 [Galerina marginata CBS 339.88]|uniref:Uncharacterized protein n=1 Tax=Galerina marginata (strain CBS 339.88) TaxID=685588 RepID=A0A067SQ39_GALM3|nr:hypothetical protein GALMADRAFT_746803 [Galerina marginata CBS 339.88]
MPSLYAESLFFACVVCSFALAFCFNFTIFQAANTIGARNTHRRRKTKRRTAPLDRARNFALPPTIPLPDAWVLASSSGGSTYLRSLRSCGAVFVAPFVIRCSLRPFFCFQSFFLVVNCLRNCYLNCSMSFCFTSLQPPVSCAPVLVL